MDDEGNLIDHNNFSTKFIFNLPYIEFLQVCNAIPPEFIFLTTNIMSNISKD